MKLRIFALMLAMLPVLAAAKVVVPEKKMVSQERICPREFTEIDISSAITLILENGPECKVRVEAYENVLPVVETVISRGTILIRIKSGITFRNNPNIKVFVTMPTLTRLASSGACDIRTTGTMESDLPLSIRLSGAVNLNGSYKAAAINITASGASDCKPSLVCDGAARIAASGASNIKGSIECGDLSLEATGASDIELKGTCGALDVKCSGASDLKCYELVSASIRGRVSGASDGQFFTTGTEDISTSGAGSANIKKPDGSVIKKR